MSSMRGCAGVTVVRPAFDSTPAIGYNASLPKRDGLNSSSRFFTVIPANPFFERIAVLRGARTLAVLRVLSRVLRS